MIEAIKLTADTSSNLRSSFLTQKDYLLGEKGSEIRYLSVNLGDFLASQSKRRKSVVPGSLPTNLFESDKSQNQTLKLELNQLK